LRPCGRASHRARRAQAIATLVLGAAALTAWLGSCFAGPAGAALSGANGQIAYYRLPPPDPNAEIYSMNADGTGQTRLTTLANGARFPAWSPDGSRIAYTSTGSTTSNEDIYLINADGSVSGNDRLTDDPGVDYAPSWSPDGSRIAFRSSRDGNNEIYVMGADGQNQTRLTFDPGFDDHPAWSPDGTRIAFSSDRSGNSDIWVMQADGTAPKRLTTSPANDYDPDWSPDGSSIVFDSDRDGLGDVYVMGADGSEQRRLTTDPSFDDQPAWSPDGTRIAFVSRRDGNSEIYSMNPDGTDQRRLTATPSDEQAPAWQPLANPVPSLSSLTPQSIQAGSPGMVLTLDGAAFVPRSIVRWNGAARPTTYVAPGRLRAQIPASDLAHEGTASVSVVNPSLGGGTSGGLPFTIVTPSVAVTTTLGPTGTPAPHTNSASGPLTISSAVFRVRWHAGRSIGSLLLRGRADRRLVATIALNRAGAKPTKKSQLARLTLKPGPFSRSVRLPSTIRLLPGSYVLRLTGTGFTLPVSALLPAPPEGVVSKAGIALHSGQRAQARIKGRPTIIFATFAFAALPKRSLPLTTVWSGPEKAKGRTPVARSAVVTSFVGSTDSKAVLPSGRWRCRLYVGKTLVASATTTVG
jgi:WD40 repeat protein